jgi:hypothetical protein
MNKNIIAAYPERNWRPVVTFICFLSVSSNSPSYKPDIGTAIG